MSSSSELEKFRQEWRRELQHNVQDESGRVKSSVSADSKSVNDVELNKVDHYKDDYLPSASVKSSVAFSPLSEDDTSQDALVDAEEAKNVARPSTSNIHDTEYYPFKILTQFLNEAPRRKRAKNNEMETNITGLSFTKRKYFSSESPQTNKKKLKEAKSDPGNHLSEDSQPAKRMLDIFIADLDDINEIPFFDTTLPREVALRIFQHLDVKTLCNCSQVSHSWRSLANDELLWAEISHKLGYDTEVHVSEEQDWKGRVRRHIEQKQLLNANWKARIGKPYHLNFARGGVLCAVHSHGSNIVAGYTSCNVRSWDTQTGDVCTFNASNTALVLDEAAEELGRIHNEIKHVSSTAFVTAASFRHGFVDVWRNDASTEPIHTFSFRNPDIASLSTQDLSHTCSLVTACQGTRVQIANVGEMCGESLSDFDMHAAVNQLNWFSSCLSSKQPRLLITCHNSVHLKRVDLPSTWALRPSNSDEQSLVEVHNIIWAPITCVNFRACTEQVAVGFNLYTGPSTQVKVNIYDVSRNHLTATLTGHTWLISSIHMPDSLTDQLVTGSGDRKIRLYDLRVGSFPTMTLVGHVAKVMSVEMDNWKVVSGDEGGFVDVWDQRMGRKLWDIHNRHPVQYCHFDERLLIIGNVPYQKFPEADEFETVSSLRHRGTLQVYDFLANQQTQGIPDICLSSYSEPEAYDYNIQLAVPYDSVN